VDAQVLEIGRLVLALGAQQLLVTMNGMSWCHHLSLRQIQSSEQGCDVLADRFVHYDLTQPRPMGWKDGI
jgi:hypothetical protein